jgi:hypothetical protein
VHRSLGLGLALLVGCDLKPVGPPPIAPKSADTSNVRQQAERISKAVLERDYNTVADLTYPRIVRAAGGREKLIERMKAIAKSADDEGLIITASEVGEPGEPVIDSGTGYVILPTTLRLKGPGVRGVSESYLLGITEDGGKSWTFVDGAGLGKPEERSLVFPVPPKGLVLPEKKPPVFNDVRD